MFFKIFISLSKRFLSLFSIIWFFNISFIATFSFVCLFIPKRTILNVPSPNFFVNMKSHN